MFICKMTICPHAGACENVCGFSVSNIIILKLIDLLMHYELRVAN